MNYSPYGFTPNPKCRTTLLTYNGEYLHKSVSLYLLGNGHRAFTPKLMRFLSPDSCSPFLQGGLNCYGYCSGDPINFKDPSGQTPQKRVPLKRLKPKRIPSNYSGNLRPAEHKELVRRIEYHTSQAEDAVGLATNATQEARRFMEAAVLSRDSAMQSASSASAREHALALQNSSQQAEQHLQASVAFIQRFENEQSQARALRITKREFERNHKENLMNSGNGNFQTQAIRINGTIPAQNQNIIIRQHPER